MFALGALNLPINSTNNQSKGSIYLNRILSPATSITISYVTFFSGSIAAANWQNAYLGIYSRAGILQATTNLIPTPVTNSVNKIAFQTPLVLTPNTPYWLAFQIGLSTTTPGSIYAGGNLSRPTVGTMPALGTLTDQYSLATSLATFDSTLPTDLSAIAFVKGTSNTVLVFGFD